MRLRSVLSDLPKPMAGVAGRPFLAYLLEYLESQGIRRVVLSVGYRFEAIRNYFGDQHGSIRIVYAVEEEPLGTGGAIANALPLVESPVFFVCNGDTFLKLDYRAMASLAELDRESFELAVALRQIEDTSRYGRAVLAGGRLEGFNALGAGGPGLINAGVYLMTSQIFSKLDLPRKFSFEKEFLESRAAALRPLAFPCDVPFIDIGIPAALEEAQVLLPAWIASL